MVTTHSVMTKGASMSTSSTYLHPSTLSTLSCRFMMGMFDPRYRFTIWSLCTPTIKKPFSAAYCSAYHTHTAAST